MEHLKKTKKIQEISTWDSSQTTEKYVDLDRITMLEPTPQNMHLLMCKINELVKKVNKLKK